MSNLSIQDCHTSEIEIKGSRFICHLFPIETEDDALEYLSMIRKEHAKATHNCYAYLLGPDDLVQRMSDDGEPSQTAGVPMLEVLKKQELHDVLAIVTRYFGGVKLGAGGLIRAYTEAVAHALDESIIVDRVVHQFFKVTFDYKTIDSFDYFLNQQQIDVSDRNYLEQVTYELHVPVEAYQHCHDELINFFQNNVEIEMTKKEVMPTPIKD
ncbi:YigZ family protein [Atopobacter phocae]|uniref:YigZ family protein n=1 Tax=Atopobacter phocae TaxID=136492 RepID=UPI00046EDF45|nr:YigZ family protein [Atopobacter phocae]